MPRPAALVILCLLTGIPARADDKVFHPVDLQAKANRRLADNQGTGAPGNSLAGLPTGEQTLGGVTFQVGERLVQLGSQVLDDLPEKVEGIKVGRKFAALHLLHATGFGGGPNRPGDPWFVEDGTLIGEYRIHYEDGKTETLPVVYGEDVRDWFFRDDEQEPSRSRVVWKGDNDRARSVDCRLRLYLTTWRNPRADQTVTSIDYTGRKDETVAAPFCVAVTVEE